MSFDLILPFFRPIEHLLLSDTVSEIMVNQRILIFRPIAAARSFEVKVGPDRTGPVTQLPFGSGSRGHVEGSSL